MARTGLDGALGWWASVDQAPVGELWVPPRVELVPDSLHQRPAIAWWPWPAGEGWDWDGDPDTALRAWRCAAPDRGMLAAFLALAHGEPAAVVGFVRRYGPLGHHADGPRPELVHPGAWLPDALGADPGPRPPVVEPVAAYQTLARRMNAILRVLAACAETGPGRGRRLGACRDDLAVLVSDAGVAEQLPIPAHDYAAELSPAAAQELALNHVDVLLAQARPALDLRLRPAPWDRAQGTASAEPVPWPTAVTLWPRGAFAALAVQLAAAVTALPQQAVCDECGAVYTPRRRPRAGEAHYCGRCGQGDRYRAAKRRWWQQARSGSRPGGEGAA